MAEDASPEEVRHAYRRLAKAAHPDAAGDPDAFRAVTLAYEVLSEPARRAAYDRTLRRPPAPVPLRRRRHLGRWMVALAGALIAAGVAALVVATAGQSVGDDCLVGTWRGEAFDVPFRATVGGRDVSAQLRGGDGVTLTVLADGRVRVNYATATPLTGSAGSDRIEGTYEGTSIERWEAAGGRVTARSDASAVRFLARVNGEPLGQPLAVGVLDGEYPYACTPASLEVGPYRYTRAFTAPGTGG